VNETELRLQGERRKEKRRFDIKLRKALVKANTSLRFILYYSTRRVREWRYRSMYS
jgi:hypothetical protein